MKKQLPIVLGVIVGFFAVAEFYIPAHSVGTIQEHLLDWGMILAAAAFVLGGINVLQVNWPKIKRREADWQYKIVLLVAATGMMLVGVSWHTFGGERSSGTVSLATGYSTEAQLVVNAAHPEAMVSVDGAPAVAVASMPGALSIEPNKDVKVRVFMPPEIKGYAEFEITVSLAAGEVATVNTDLVMMWGKSGRVYTWFYDHVFDPCNSTMFALLAFFIASAAFRAFRARNTEAALLLGAAILVMVGRAPVGGQLSEFFPDLATWILDVPNNAGRRAIMMGAALGAIVTALRVILGLERSHLGSD